MRALREFFVNVLVILLSVASFVALEYSVQRKATEDAFRGMMNRGELKVIIEPPKFEFQDELEELFPDLKDA